jgi:hypothetical protein
MFPLTIGSGSWLGHLGNARLRNPVEALPAAGGLSKGAPVAVSLNI